MPGVRRKSIRNIGRVDEPRAGVRQRHRPAGRVGSRLGFRRAARVEHPGDVEKNKMRLSCSDAQATACCANPPKYMACAIIQTWCVRMGAMDNERCSDPDQAGHSRGLL